MVNCNHIIIIITSAMVGICYMKNEVAVYLQAYNRVKQITRAQK